MASAGRLVGPRAIPDHAAMETFSSGGLKIAYDDIAPHGPANGTVVLVHGFATNRDENWKRLGWYTAFARKGYRVLAFDHRGHGESDKPHEAAAYARDAMAGDILGLMDHVGVGQADVMGYSMGARLSLEAALSHPDRVTNLILGGIGGRMLPGGEEGQAAPTSTMTMSQAMEAEDPSVITEPTLKGFRQFADQQGEDRLALAACSKGQGAPVDVDRLSSLSMPVLVVAGTRDQLAGDPQRLADAIPGAKCVSLPGCDHFSAIPHALFKAAVFDFFDGWLEEMPEHLR
jgi:pimeloyl-ACP methyl ester carboxylesterase